MALLMSPLMIPHVVLGIAFLVGLLLVREGGGGPAQVRLPEAAYASADMVRAVPIRAGKADLEVQVSVVWSLE